MNMVSHWLRAVASHIHVTQAWRLCLKAVYSGISEQACTIHFQFQMNFNQVEFQIRFSFHKDLPSYFKKVYHF